MVREQGPGLNGKGPTAADDAYAGSRWAYAFLPYLLTIGFPVAILVGNIDSMPSLAAIATTVGSLLLAVAVLDVMLRLFVRRSPCRELLLGTAVVYVMGYGYVAQPLRFLGFRQVYCFPIWCLLFLSLTIFIAKASGKSILRRVASLLQYILVSMVCLQVTWLGIALSNEGLRGKPISRLVAASNSPPAVPFTELPNIYYIILDGYGREDVLRESYQFDNRGFLESLRKRGFYVANQSRPNYSQTALSLSSSLNMRYLNDLGLEAHSTRWPLHDMIQGSEVTRCLKQHGYKAVAVQSGYPLTECPSFDRYISICPLMLDDFQLACFDTSCFCPLQYLLSCWTGSCYSSHRRLLLGDLTAIPHATENSRSPCFVFAHLLLPHPPFVFDAQGNPVEPAMHVFGSRWDHRQYSDQVAFANTQLTTLVDKILSSSRRPSLIILQGDHGPGTEWFPQKVSFAERLRQRFGILNAIYLPPGVNVGLYATMTPVNTFRVILDHYFRTNLGRLEDRGYFSEYASPYAFADVTPNRCESVADRRK